MELREVFQKFVNMSHAERVEMGRGAMVALAEDLTKHGLDKDDAFKIVHAVVSVALSADRVTAAEEYRLFADITGSNVSFKDFFEATDGAANPDVVNDLDEFLDKMSENGKNAALTLALCFIAADDVITPEEQNLFKKLLA